MMPGNEILIRMLVEHRLFEIHPIPLGKSFDLAMTKHGKARQSSKQYRNTKVLIPRPELVDCRPFVRIAHEVDVALQNVGIKLDGLL